MQEYYKSMNASSEITANLSMVFIEYVRSAEEISEERALVKSYCILYSY